MPKALVFKLRKIDYDAMLESKKTTEEKLRVKSRVTTHLRLVGEINDILEWATNRWRDRSSLNTAVQTLSKLRKSLQASAKGFSTFKNMGCDLAVSTLSNDLDETISAIGERARSLFSNSDFSYTVYDILHAWEHTIACEDTAQDSNNSPIWQGLLSHANHALRNTHSHYVLHSRMASSNVHLFIPTANDGKRFHQIISIPESDNESVYIGRIHLPIKQQDKNTLHAALLGAIRQSTDKRSVYSFANLMRLENTFRIPFHVRQAIDAYFKPFEVNTDVSSVDVAAVNPAIIFRNWRAAQALWRKNGGIPSDRDDMLQFVKLLAGIFAATDSKFWVWIEVALEGIQTFRNKDLSEVVNPELMANNMGTDGTMVERLELERAEKEAPAEDDDKADKVSKEEDDSSEDTEEGEDGSDDTDSDAQDAESDADTSDDEVEA